MIPRVFTLKNGITALLRTAAPEDASKMIAYLRACAEETDFLLRVPEEWDIPVETEEALLRDMARQQGSRMLACIVNGEIAGTCQIVCMNRVKTRHRATVSIALRRAYWGEGIPGPMFEEMEAFARNSGVIQLELAYVQGNERARRLYERMGFVETGRGPDAIRLRDGTLLDEIFMMKKL
ncbi:MAG: GNAT family N-acetyltransferase [Clostridiales bacterium]|nr:GNAT family N-acetyltransferase [Clostridiales bacterium]MDY2657586.1 GNAT family N-acetyltransferase [Candidatus Limiplasma sp.]